MKKLNNDELDNYLKSLLGDNFEKFINSSPEPRAIRLNELKSKKNEFEKFLNRNDVRYENIKFNNNGYILNDDSLTVSHTLKYFCGHAYYQGISSQLPVILLNVKPGEKILDIAAAPGSKSCQILSELKGKGVLIANDSSAKRLQSLNVNMQRSGATNFYITNMYGERFGLIYPEYFDKVLVDAPCTALGTLMSSPEVAQWWTVNKLQKLAKSQKMLLISAIKSLKVGGELVYSTCSIAPEENELVIDEILQKYPVEVVEPYDYLKKQFSCGITTYNGKKFDSSVFNAIRIFPHIHGYEGFFAVKLKKYDSVIQHNEVKTNQMKSLLSYSDSDIQPIINNLSENWGINKSFFKNYKFNLTKERLWIVNNIDQIPINDFICVGSLMAEKRLFGWKLLNNSVSLLGNLITKRIIKLNDDDLKILFKDGLLEHTNYNNGYYILKYQEEPIASVYVENARMQIRLPHSFNLVLG